MRQEYKDLKLKPATLCFLVQDDEVLLAMKKRGFGEGKWNGVGGKVNNGETILEAVRREVREEIGVDTLELQEVAILNFYHFDADKPVHGMQVAVYLCKNWQGEPTESEEMQPQWYSRDKIPFEIMWPDDIHWLPRVLAGEVLEGNFSFNKAGELLDFEIFNK